MSEQSGEVVSSSDPDEIRQEIESTRLSLSEDVNALADRAKPGNVARRQVDKVRGAAGSLKDRVMGSSTGDTYDSGSSGSALSSARDSVAGSVSSARGAVEGTASSLSDRASAAPSQLRAQTQGNPLAAGLIAFGVGWLVSSLLPASQVEQQAALQVKDNAAPVTGAITDAAKEAAQNLKEPAQQAAESVKQTAADAANTVKQEGQSAADDVRNQAVDAKDTVQDSRS